MDTVRSRQAFLSHVFKRRKLIGRPRFSDINIYSQVALVRPPFFNMEGFSGSDNAAQDIPHR